MAGPDVATDFLRLKLSALEPEHDAVALELWQLAEVSLQEVKSSAYLIDRLEAQGFSITSRGTSGIPTAFIAEWSQGSGGPVLGILLEYDALPGLGNEAVAEKCARKDGHEHGHGCGHNLIGSAAYTAALALKQAMAETATAGKTQGLWLRV